MKHTPATPLPWPKDPWRVEPTQDEAYIIHTANAYPRLVAMVATYADDPDSPAAKLLAELGE